MKRIIVICMLMVFLANGLVGCGKKDTTGNTDVVEPENSQEVINSESPEVKPEENTENSGNTGNTNPVSTPSKEPTNEGESSQNSGSDTLGSMLVAEFKSLMSGTCTAENAANVLAEKADMDCVVMKVEEGFLNGFSGEVKGFNTGYGFSPMIGSIPFVGYVFESNDAEGLKATLLSLADPRWNICTEAEETVVAVVGNFVFFAMCPGADY